MYTLYSITNKDGRIYYGRTRDFHNQLILHNEFLKKNIHFNKLLQCVYNDRKYDPVFEIITESDDPEEITLECINLINDNNSNAIEVSKHIKKLNCKNIIARYKSYNFPSEILNNIRKIFAIKELTTRNKLDDTTKSLFFMPLPIFILSFK